MPSPASPADWSAREDAVIADPVRLRAVRETALLDTPSEEAFDRLTRLAAKALNVPVALVNLITEDRQFFKSCLGLPEPWASTREMPLTGGFCPYALRTGAPVTIGDARQDPEVCDNPIVREVGAVAYAGVPIRTSEGHVLGTFCVVDTRRRAWSEEDVRTLEDFAAAAVTEIELRAELAERRRAEVERDRAVEMLRESEQRHRAVFNQAYSFLGVMTPDGTLVDANEAAFQAGGFTRGEALGRPFWETPWWQGLPEEQAALREGIAAAAAGEVIRAESLFVTADGSHRVVDRTLTPVMDEAGRVAFVLASGVDITEMKAAQQETLSTVERMRFLMDAMPQKVWTADAYGNVNFFNRRWLEYTGLGLEELRGWGWKQIIHPDDWEENFRLWRHSVDTGHDFELEHRFRRWDGEYRWHLSRGLAQRDEEGNILSWVGTNTDIHEQKRVAEALRESEERFRQLAENIQEVFWISDPEYTHVFYVSLAYEEIWGRTLDSLYQDPRSFLEAVHPEDRARVESALERLLPQGEYDVEYRIQRPDGQTRWIRARGFPVRDARGEIYRIAGIAEDISQGKSAEKERERLVHELEKERGLFEAALDQMPAGLIVAEAPSGKLVLSNAQVDHILGHPLIHSDGIEEYQVYQGFHPDGRAYEPHEWPLARSITTGEVVVEEDIEYLRGDGTRVIIRTSSAPVRDFEGRIVAGVVTFYDVTERQRATERLQFLSSISAELGQSLDYSDTLQAVARLAVPVLGDFCMIDVEQDGSFQRVAVAHADPELEQAYAELQRRYPPDPSKSPLVRVFRTGKPELVPRVSEHWMRAVARDEEHARLIRDLGVTSVMLVPLVARGRVLGIATLAVTTRSGREYGTEDFALAEELARRAALAMDNARLYHEARQAVRAREDVLAIVSHDLRNPLNTIFMTAALLLDMPLRAEQTSQHLQMIRRSAESMNRLLQDLLDVTRVEAGQQLHIEPHPMAAAPLVREISELLQPQLKAKALRLEASVSGDLRVLADRDRIHQVLSNLLGNAIKFIPNGGWVRVRAEPEGAQVRFSVEDNGPGIPEEALPHVFDRYWQARDTARAGTGLGLAIARGIVEAHGGRIWVESRVGEGTTFCFTVPAADSAASPEVP